MSRKGLFAAVILVAILIAVAIIVSWIAPGPGSPSEVPVYTAEVIRTYPHDSSAFTQGLAYDDGVIIEGTGLVGRSGIRTVNLTTGEVMKIRNISGDDFGEGITALGNRIFQLTELSHTCFSYDRQTLEPAGTFTYPTAGWGLTTDGESLIMSDGTNRLYFLDPETFALTRRLEVRAGGDPVWYLNELEYIRGEIYANIWPGQRVAVISPVTGQVNAWIDLSGLPLEKDRERINFSAVSALIGNSSLPLESQACPNGIAFDPENGRLFVTGKLWPSLYEIRLVPKGPSNS